MAQVVGERPLDGLRCESLAARGETVCPVRLRVEGLRGAVLAVDDQGGREDEVPDEDDDLELKRDTLPPEVIIFEPPLLS